MGVVHVKASLVYTSAVGVVGTMLTRRNELAPMRAAGVVAVPAEVRGHGRGHHHGRMFLLLKMARSLAFHVERCDRLG
jgi:hypothetical protein